MSDPITVQVALRIRPLVESEISRGCRKCLQTIQSENQVQVIGTDKAFTYNCVFDETISQIEFYNCAVKQMVAKLFRGFNVTILAYGQTGSGKTHSMGTCYDGSGEMGVIPRAIIDIFDYVQEKSVTHDFKISVSFMELYNENLYDLLSTKPREQTIIDIREDNKGIIMPGLTETPVLDKEQTVKCLIDGSAGRATGATAMNAQSSRSHAIFTITVYMAKKNDENNATTAKFHLVDLAGSERSKKTKATGDRFKEGININKGLLALGNVISALGEENQKGYISYRDSKLTRLLQDSLGGNSMTLMIACVSPADYNLEETISTLRYADRARKIKNKPVVNQDPRAAEINRLNQLVNQLRLQLLGEGDAHISNDELIKIKEENLAQKAKIRELNTALSSALAENTNMFERQLLTQTANERLKKKLLELQESYNITLSNLTLTVGQGDCPGTIKDQIDKLECMKHMIIDIHSEHQKNEEEIQNHEFQTQAKTPNSAHLQFSERDLDEEQEKHCMEQLNLNKELQELNRQLALKEKLASQIISNNNHMVDYMQQSENEKKISTLERERNELLSQLRNQSKDVCSKLAEQRRQRVKELEVQISELNRKLLEQARLIKLKEKDDLKIKQLHNEIQMMKTNKVKLIKNMRAEEQKFRTWKLQRERELTKLKDQDRKRQNQIVKMENMHQKQQTVLKRKFEEAVAVIKRLKGASALQKLAQERRNQANGKLDRIQQWVVHELDIMVSTVESKRTLQHLFEARDLMNQQLENYQNNLDESESVDVEEEIKKINSEIELTNAQITDIQQRIIDSDHENKSKTRWDTVQSMVEAKCALKQLFDLAADIRFKAFDTEYKLKEYESKIEELNFAHAKAIDKLSESERRLKKLGQEHEQQLGQVVRENEEKVYVLLKELRGIKTCSDDESINERLRIQEEALQKMDSLQNTLDEYREKCTQLEETLEKVSKESQKISQSLNNPSKKNKINTTFIREDIILDTDVDSCNEDDREKDPDWVRTPLFKRMRSYKSIKSKIEQENLARETVKRTSDGTAKCTCNKGSCKSKLCGCRKLSSFCTDLCKCTNCTNRPDSSQSDKNRKVEETESEDSFKRPRVLLESNDPFFQPLKYKKSYFKIDDDSESS